MKKKATNKKNTTPRRRASAPRTDLPKAPAIPTLAAMLTVFMDRNYQQVPDEFLIAWAQMPAITARIAAGQAVSKDFPTADTLISQMIDAAVEKSRHGADHWDRRLAAAVDAIDDLNEDSWIDLRLAIGEPAFWTGAALATYLLINAPVVIAGGAR